jgi:isocitrate dehydrogenase (NAD+)
MNTVTLIPGDGIGPEITRSLQAVFAAAGAKIEWDVQEAGLDVLAQTGSLVPESVFSSIERHRVALKGPLATPIGTGHRSLNVMLRQRYDLYACVRPVKSIQGVATRYTDVDLVIFRENTEDLYAGKEIKVSADEAHSLKIITRHASTRIAEAAFDYALAHHRNHVTIVTKANIMKLSDGLFLEACRDVAKRYPQIKTTEILVDNLCMQLVVDPSRFDILLTENLYGDILSDLAAGLVGGLGFVPGANLGKDIAIFEAVHGTAPDIAGQDKANPTALLLSGVLMLRHLKQFDVADRIETAVLSVLTDPNVVTADRGGPIGTQALTQLILRALGA